MIVAECNRLWKHDPEKKKTAMSSSDATALLYNAGLSVNQYQMLRTICLTHDIDLPTRNSVDSVKSSFHPIIVSQELKSSVDVKPH